MKSRYYLKALFGCSVIAFALMSRAQEATSPLPSPAETTSGTQGGSQGGYVQKLIKTLGLTDAQVGQIKTILQTSEGQFKTIMDNSSLTQDQKSEQFKALEESTHQQINSVLTPEQQQKFSAFLHQFQGHHVQRR
jgi:Spy/CpxP family protein refolding chaperone